MRTALFAIAALILGSIVGVVIARQEFAGEVLPISASSSEAGDTRGPNGRVGPRLTILSAERHDFGEMDHDALMHHTFEIRNDGDEPLIITQLGTSCKCTTAGLDNDRLQPKEAAKIKMEWTAKNAVDPYEQYAEYETNDPRRPKFRLLVYGHVHKTLHAEPAEAVFNRVSSLEPAQAKLRLYGMREGKLEIVKHQFTKSETAGFFSLQSRPLSTEELATTAARCGLELTVDLKPGMRIGQIDQTLQITTNLNPEATLDIPVYGSVVSDISLAGQHVSAEKMLVSLGSASSSRGIKSTIYLVVKGEHREETELKIAEVSPAAELKVELGEPLRTNPQIVSYPVTLEVPPGATPVSRNSTGSQVMVRVETTHPELKELVFHVRYVVID